MNKSCGHKNDHIIIKSDIDSLHYYYKRYEFQHYYNLLCYTNNHMNESI